MNTEIEKTEVVEQEADLAAKPQGKQISTKSLNKIVRRANLKRREVEVEELVKQYTENLQPKTKREVQLVRRIAELQLQINHDINVEASKRVAARLIKRVVG